MLKSRQSQFVCGGQLSLKPRLYIGADNIVKNRNSGILQFVC